MRITDTKQQNAESNSKGKIENKLKTRKQPQTRTQDALKTNRTQTIIRLTNISQTDQTGTKPLSREAEKRWLNKHYRGRLKQIAKSEEGVGTRQTDNLIKTDQKG